jgi:sec-independent protein translocase protein TatC
MRQHDRAESEDLFAATRMALGDHIEELRGHLGRALIGFGVALVAGFCVSPYVLEALAAPVSRQLNKFYERRLARAAQKLAEGDRDLGEANRPGAGVLTVSRPQLLRALRLKDPDPAAEEWVDLPVRVKPVDWAVLLGRAQRLVGRPPTLTVLQATEGFTSYFKVSVYCGAILSSPWLFYQLWAFVAAGLYPHEKRLVHVYLPVSVGLFLAGVALCELAVLPVGLDYLLSFNEWLGWEPDLRLSDWLSFATLMPLLFGCAFQTPLVMVFLDRVGVLSAEAYRSHRRLAVFLLALLAALLSVSPDWYSMLALAVPLWGLYEIGILLCRFGPGAAPHPARVDVLALTEDE